MTTPAPSPYSYYASQTVRTLRGILDAGISATGWSSSSTATTSTSSWPSSDGSYGDTLRAAGMKQQAGMPEIQRRPSGGGVKKSSRPGIGDLFDDARDTRVVDQGDAKVEALPRHNRNGHDGSNIHKQDSNSSKTSLNLDRMLFHAGSHADPYATDTDSNVKLPLLALCPCNLPSEITDLVISQLSTRLDSYAQEPYMLIVFASPSNPIPVQHLIRYYRALAPEVRRNIARLWICHPGLFTKIAVKLFLNTIVSGKVTRKGKVKLVDSLSALGNDLNLSQIEIPPQVLIHDSKVKGKLSLGPFYIGKPVYGAPLSEVMTTNQLPRPISEAISHLRTGTNLQTVGLFRKTPSITLLEVLKNAYECNLSISFSEWPDSVILAGSLLKNYLRNLRYPLFPSCVYGDIRKCPGENDEAVEYIRNVLMVKLVERHPDGELVLVLLKELLGLLRDVALHKDINQMDSHNLAVVFLPVLVRSADIQQDAMICTMPRKITSLDEAHKSSQNIKNGQNTGSSSLGMIIKLCVERYDDIFPSTEGSHKQAITGSSEGSTDITPGSDSSRSTSSASASSSTHKETLRRKDRNATLKLLGSPGTVKRMNGKLARSEASRESARGLFARE